MDYEFPAQMSMISSLLLLFRAFTVAYFPEFSKIGQCLNALLMVSHTSHSLFGLQCNLHGAVPEEHSEVTTGPECNGIGIDSSGHIFVAALFFPVDFWVQFKLLISTYKSLHDGQLIFEDTCSLFLLIASDLTG